MLLRQRLLFTILLNNYYCNNSILNLYLRQAFCIDDIYSRIRFHKDYLFYATYILFSFVRYSLFIIFACVCKIKCSVIYCELNLIHSLNVVIVAFPIKIEVKILHKARCVLCCYGGGVTLSVYS